MTDIIKNALEVAVETHRIITRCHPVKTLIERKTSERIVDCYAAALTELAALRTELAHASMAATAEANYSKELQTEVVALRAKVAIRHGWHLVPKVPTEDMIIAFAESWYSKDRPIDDCELDDAYLAMIAAAPQPPADTTFAQNQMENPL